jgi:hypothetical protein
VPPRERELPPREREVLPFARELVPRDDFAAPVDRFADVLRAPVDLPVPIALRVAVDLRVPVDLRAADERVAPEVDDLAREDVDFFAPVERDDVERFAVERDPAALRVPVDLLVPRLEAADDPELALALEPSVGDHLPDITRCAASATASAMIEPSLVALETTLLAARSAVSAASSPASRIFFRAAGLALIAAAAAASPAASISLLIAAFASLSTVALFEPERDDVPRERDDDEREPEDDDLLREELLRVDLAIV